MADYSWTSVCITTTRNDGSPINGDETIANVLNKFRDFNMIKSIPQELVGIAFDDNVKNYMSLKRHCPTNDINDLMWYQEQYRSQNDHLSRNVLIEFVEREQRCDGFVDEITWAIHNWGCPSNVMDFNINSAETAICIETKDREPYWLLWQLSKEHPNWCFEVRSANLLDNTSATHYTLQDGRKSMIMYQGNRLNKKAFKTFCDNILNLS